MDAPAASLASSPPMPLEPSARKVQEALAAAGFSNQVVELPGSTRTAAEAAAAVGCQVGQIAKSLVFRTASGRAVLVVASGAHRVDEKRVAAELGEAIGKADAELVRAETGFAIGGVPPIGHARELVTLVDEALLAFAEIWAAAGHPHAVFRLTPAELVRMTRGRVTRVA
ncbi:MAG TPA: YbaK/EbsC family protein [Anaeromyxobacter sp.]